MYGVRRQGGREGGRGMRDGEGGREDRAGKKRQGEC